MINVMYCVLYVLAAWLWGDWRNWKKYQSTILYLITCNLLYNYLGYNHSLWEYEPSIFYPNHTMMSLMAMFIAFPSVMLVYLGRYPSGRMRQILWIGFWVFQWTFLEWMSVKLGQISYHNGWNLMWSAGLDIALFSMVRLHYTKPLLTYGFSVIATVGLLMIFHVSTAEMK